MRESTWSFFSSFPVLFCSLRYSFYILVILLPLPFPPLLLSLFHRCFLLFADIWRQYPFSCTLFSLHAFFFSISSQVVIRLTIYVTRQISINHKHNHQPQRRKKNDRNLTLSHHHPHTFSLCRASLYHLPLLSFPPPHPNERSISVLFIAILNNS